MHELKEIELKQRGSKFEANFTGQMDRDIWGSGKSVKETLISKEYYVCGLILFQVKVDCVRLSNDGKHNQTFTTSLKFRKTGCSDSQLMKIICSSNKLCLKNTIFIPDDAEWRLVCQSASGYSYSFDITFDIDLLSTGITSSFSMAEDTEFTDFELCGENGSVKVHKAMMAGHSPVLKTLFSGQWKETATGKVEVPHTRVETLQHLKDYVYLQKLPDDGVKELLHLASYYMMTDLQQKCSIKLLREISAENVIDLLGFAIKYEVKYLLMAILTLIHGRAIDIAEIDKYCPFEELSKMTDT